MWYFLRYPYSSSVPRTFAMRTSWNERQGEREQKGGRPPVFHRGRAAQIQELSFWKHPRWKEYLPWNLFLQHVQKTSLLQKAVKHNPRWLNDARSDILPARWSDPQNLPIIHTEMQRWQMSHEISQVANSLLGHNCPGHGRRAPFGRSCLPAYSLNSTCLSCSHTSEGRKEKLSEKACSPRPGSPNAQAASAFSLHSQPLSNPGNALAGKTRQPKGGRGAAPSGVAG